MSKEIPPYSTNIQLYMHVVSEGIPPHSPNSQIFNESDFFELTWIESLESRKDKLP